MAALLLLGAVTMAPNTDNITTMWGRKCDSPSAFCFDNNLTPQLRYDDKIILWRI